MHDERPESSTHLKSDDELISDVKTILEKITKEGIAINSYGGGQGQTRPAF